MKIEKDPSTTQSGPTLSVNMGVSTEEKRRGDQ